MRILVLGAGATGGYFGGRLAQAGVDVTFLVRPGRAQRLASDGLVIRSPVGDWRGAVQALTADRLGAPFDVVILSCKAYDLDDAILAIKPAVGPSTAVLPLLNGLRHFGALDSAFGAGRVIGGLCHIGATLGPAGEIVHLNANEKLTFGERGGGRSARCDAIAAAFGRARFTSVCSEAVEQDLWEKFSFLASLAAMSCLMRGKVGEIVEATDGSALMLEAMGECVKVAAAAGHKPRPPAMEFARKALTEKGSGFASSMMRDLEAGGRTEGSHILGDMLERARAAGIGAPILRMANCLLETHELKRAARAAASAPQR